jgi:hypothetical protein
MDIFPDKPPERKARTIVVISGRCIQTIPKGTEFIVTHRGTYFSSCKGLGITDLWNDEYELIVEKDERPKT